jgi:hypothetical protein
MHTKTERLETSDEKASVQSIAIVVFAAEARLRRDVRLGEPSPTSVTGSAEGSDDLGMSAATCSSAERHSACVATRFPSTSVTAKHREIGAAGHKRGKNCP